MQPWSQGERCELRLQRIAACKLPKWGLGQSPSLNRILYIFYPQNLTFSGNDSNDLPDNQLTKF